MTAPSRSRASRIFPTSSRYVAPSSRVVRPRRSGGPGLVRCGAASYRRGCEGVPRLHRPAPRPDGRGVRPRRGPVGPGRRPGRGRLAARDRARGRALRGRVLAAARAAAGRLRPRRVRARRPCLRGAGAVALRGRTSTEVDPLRHREVPRARGPTSRPRPSSSSATPVRCSTGTRCGPGRAAQHGAHGGRAATAKARPSRATTSASSHQRDDRHRGEGDSSAT